MYLHYIQYFFKKNSYFCISDFDINKQCCTFQKTGERSQYQQCYRCNTCMNSWDVVCIVCAKVCHSGPGHDVVYEGYMKSYCDCGSGRIRNNSCKALLTPRASSPNPNNVEQVVTSSSPLLPRQGKYYIFDNM